MSWPTCPLCGIEARPGATCAHDEPQPGSALERRRGRGRVLGCPWVLKDGRISVSP